MRASLNEKSNDFKKSSMPTMKKIEKKKEKSKVNVITTNII